MDWKTILSDKREKPTSRVSLQNDLRNEFESDYGRIVFSPALRRMHDKTQVFPLITDDNIHTRLTHSLEVASVASSLGINLCNKTAFIQRTKIPKEDLLRQIPVILSSVSLCHDIGNPPFGHYGEEVIASYFEEFFTDRRSKKLLKDENEIKDFTKFNGNAQGFRVLSKLQVLQDTYGLNLTYGTLSAYLKYPYLSNELKSTGFRKKLGVFQSEKQLLNNIRQETGLNEIRHPLAFLMEAADSICYLTMDLEDGFNRGFYSFGEVEKYLIDNGNNALKTKLSDFLSKNSKALNSEINRERTSIVKLRIFLIQELVNLALENFLSNIDVIEAGNYSKELIKDDNKNGFAEILGNFCFENVYKQREIESLELTGCSVIRGLFDHFVPALMYNDIKADKLYNLISRSLRTIVELETGKDELSKIPNYYILRLIVDYISGMTDKFALNLYQRLKGITIK